ncbi:MAG: tetratricopeptide repeat protein [Planctomycetota bacterium]
MPAKASLMDRMLPAVVGLAAWLVGSVAAQDTVHVANEKSARGYAEWKGRVLDYTGRELQLELPGGLKRSFPAEEVLRIETQHTARQVEADRRFNEGEYGSALALYREARSTEPRRWVRRQITARMVWCHRALDQPELAGAEFLVLLLDDPTTPYFPCIPLAWVASQPSLALERAAEEWLGRDEMPAAVLLGASHLMSTGARAKALERLKGLAADADERVRFLAFAQTWRASIVTADPAELASWLATVERMPEPLRAGPYYVLGLARAQRQQWDGAALAWLRIPILYPEHRLLAARALWDAGRSLEKLGRSEQAEPLYRELTETYPKTPAAAEARSRSEEMMNDER